MTDDKNRKYITVNDLCEKSLNVISESLKLIFIVSYIFVLAGMFILMLLDTFNYYNFDFNFNYYSIKICFIVGLITIPTLILLIIVILCIWNYLANIKIYY